MVGLKAVSGPDEERAETIERAARPEFRLRLEEQVGHLLRRAYQRHVMVFQSHLDEYKLTAAQCIALAKLLEHGLCSQSDLARLTAIDHTSIRGIVSRLKKRGLLRTEVDSNDARKVTIFLTPPGKALIEKALLRIDDISEDTFNGINDTEKEALKYLLRRVADLGPVNGAGLHDAGGAVLGTPAGSEPGQGQPVEPETPGPGYKLRLDDRVGYLLRRAYQRHVVIFQHYLSEFQLTAAQCIVLGTVFELGVCSQSELSRHTVIDHTTIRGIISRLGARGLMFTEVDPVDARKVNVVLTEQGREISREAFFRIDSVSSETFNGINQAEQVALLYLLRRVADIRIT